MVKTKPLDQVRAAVRVSHPTLYAKQEGFPALREVVSRSSIPARLACARAMADRRKQCNKEKNPVHLVYPVQK